MTSIMNVPATYSIRKIQPGVSVLWFELYCEGLFIARTATKQEAGQAAREHYNNSLEK